MKRESLLTALAPVSDLEEIVTPKQQGNEFAIKDDGLYFQPAIGMADEYKVGSDAAAQALRHVPGLSAAAIKEWPTDLLLAPMNWWYQHGEGDVRTLVNGDEVVSFTKTASNGLHNPVRLVEAVEDVVQELGGSFSAEHGIGVSKLETMKRRKDPVALDAMRAIKAALDPNNILNPGKVIPDA